MNYVLLLHVNERIDDLLHELAHGLLHELQGRLLFEEREQFSSRGVLHQKVHVFGVVEDPEELDDAWMAQVVHDEGLSIDLLF